MRQLRKYLAFTIVEVLIVISILAILAALLFPVFSRVHENARHVSCVSNLKQLGLAFAQYEQDDDGRLPNGDWIGFNGNGGERRDTRRTRDSGKVGERWLTSASILRGFVRPIRFGWRLRRQRIPARRYIARVKLVGEARSGRRVALPC